VGTSTLYCATLPGLLYRLSAYVSNGDDWCSDNALETLAHEKRRKVFRQMHHGIKGFVIPTKSFVKIGITKIFCYKDKMFCPINKRLVAVAKFLVAATKKLLVVPNFVAVTKPFFP